MLGVKMDVKLLLCCFSRRKSISSLVIDISALKTDQSVSILFSRNCNPLPDPASSGNLLLSSHHFCCFKEGESHHVCWTGHSQQVRIGRLSTHR